MENDEKLCPITRGICIEKDCAWWSSRNDQCSISALADGVTYEMERANQGIARENMREKP